MVHRVPAAPLVTLVVAGLVVLTGCGGQDGAGAAAPTSAPSPDPVPVVEPTCIAEYPQYADAADLVDSSEVIVRGRATASRDYEIRPEVSDETDPAINPQAGVSPEEIAQIPGIPATALRVDVTEVIKGDLSVGEVIEVNQGTCTSRPLPVGEDSDYVLALEGYGPGIPYSQLNETQAAWQVGDDRSLVPVDPDNDLDVRSIDDLSTAVTAQSPSG